MATIAESLSEGYVIPDEVLRLPLLSLQLFKSVSKHWLSLITSEYFTRRLRKPRIETPCGLFTREPEYYNFVSLGPKVTSFPLHPFITDAGSHFRIMQSCNGLLLCSNYVLSTVYYVYNPFTKKVKNIPFPREPYSTHTMLAFDPTKSPYYKVVTTKAVACHTAQIQIYSSETGKWRIWGPSFPAYKIRDFEDGIYWNNAIHWISYRTKLCKLDIVDHPMVTNIQTPALDNVVHIHTKQLFTSRGSLLLLMNEGRFRYHVFEMREESSEWSVRFIVEGIFNVVPSGQLYNRFLCIVLGERGDDSFMVIESENMIVRYNFVSKTLSTLHNYVSPKLRIRPLPFIASLAGV